jgi:hypothetical protein
MAERSSSVPASPLQSPTELKAQIESEHAGLPFLDTEVSRVHVSAACSSRSAGRSRKRVAM